MQPSVLMKLCVIYPSIAILSSCGTTTPTPPESFSGQVLDVAAEQRATDCDFLRPESIPTLSQQLIDTLPPKLDGETDFGYRERLTEGQKGVYDWFQSSIRNGKRWQVYCSA